MSDFRRFLDKKGLLYQRSNTKENYIDSCFINSNALLQKYIIGDSQWYSANGINYMVGVAKSTYSDEEGVIRRYDVNFGKLIGTSEEESTRYTNPNHVSRDNSMGFIMLMGYFGYKDFVREFMWNTLMRFSFFQNTHTVKGEKKLLPDFCGPEQWAILLRSGFNKGTLILLYPLLLVLDFFYMLSYIWHVLQSHYDPTHTSTVFHMLSGVLICQETIQTPFSYIAEKVFINARAKVPGYYHSEPIVSAMEYYSRMEYDPPLDELVTRVIRYIREKV